MKMAPQPIRLRRPMISTLERSGALVDLLAFILKRTANRMEIEPVRTGGNLDDGTIQNVAQ